MSEALKDEYLTAGVPAMGCHGSRVALDGAYKTTTGQWVIDDGTATWEGTGTPTAAPDAAMIQLVVDTCAAHVAPAAVTPPSPALVLRALAKAARDKTLSQDEEDALDYVEAQ
jgi:hypothetical protein